jgi:hypothetical protein
MGLIDRIWEMRCAYDTICRRFLCNDRLHKVTGGGSSDAFAKRPILSFKPTARNR